jgi:hypothetical protein
MAEKAIASTYMYQTLKHQTCTVHAMVKNSRKQRQPMNNIDEQVKTAEQLLHDDSFDEYVQNCLKNGLYHYKFVFVVLKRCQIKLRSGTDRDKADIGSNMLSWCKIAMGQLEKFEMTSLTSNGNVSDYTRLEASEQEIQKLLETLREMNACTEAFGSERQ